MESITAEILKVGNIVFFTKTEEYWDRPYTMKRHHVYDIRSMVLRGKVTDIKGNEFKAVLVDNNGFEKDGEEFVFHKDCLLYDQDYTDFESLGKWYKK